jgi:hypothetical protein
MIFKFVKIFLLFNAGIYKTGVLHILKGNIYTNIAFLPSKKIDFDVVLQYNYLASFIYQLKLSLVSRQSRQSQVTIYKRHRIKRLSRTIPSYEHYFEMGNFFS